MSALPCSRHSRTEGRVASGKPTYQIEASATNRHLADRDSISLEPLHLAIATSFPHSTSLESLQVEVKDSRPFRLRGWKFRGGTTPNGDLALR